jgi:hypothetical protein
MGSKKPQAKETKEPSLAAVGRTMSGAGGAATNRLQPLADFRNRVVHAPPQFGFHLLQLGLQSFADRPPKHQKSAASPATSQTPWRSRR